MKSFSSWGDTPGVLGPVACPALGCLSQVRAVGRAVALGSKAGGQMLSWRVAVAFYRALSLLCPTGCPGVDP